MHQPQSARNSQRAAAPLRSLVAVTAVVLVAAACAADDPIGSLDENACDLQPVDDSAAPIADDHEDQAPEDGHDEESAEDAHSDNEVDGDHEDEAVSVDYLVQMDMLEFGYSCDLPRLDVGAVLEVQMTNIGAVEHEAVFGDLAAQNEAEAQMAEASSAEGDDGHGGDHDTPTLVLGPGESGTIVVTLAEPGDFIIGCHVAGHWDAGMRSDYVVSA